MKNTFIAIDIFGTLFNFTINKDLKYKTFLGAVFSTITFIVIIAACFFFGTDFYFRTNPKVISQITVPENYTKVSLTSKNFTISWRLEDNNGQEVEIPEGIIYSAISYSSMEADPLTKDLDYIQPPDLVPTRRCNETSNNEKFNKEKNPNSWYCIDWGSGDRFFGGNWDGDFIYYFSVSLSFCKPDKEGHRTNVCSSFQKLKEFLNNPIFFSINFPSVYFDFTDYSEPLKVEYKNMYSRLNRNLIRTDTCYFNMPLINDDRGWIFTDFQYESSISLRNCERNYVLRFDYDYEGEDINDILYNIDVYLDKGYPYYIRSFMKIQDLSATVGGFVKVITMVFSFLNLYFNTNTRDNFLINYFYDVYDVSNKNNNSNNLPKYQQSSNHFQIKEKIIFPYGCSNKHKNSVTDSKVPKRNSHNKNLNHHTDEKCMSHDLREDKLFDCCNKKFILQEDNHNIKKISNNKVNCISDHENLSENKAFFNKKLNNNSLMAVLNFISNNNVTNNISSPHNHHKFVMTQNSNNDHKINTGHKHLNNLNCHSDCNSDSCHDKAEGKTTHIHPHHQEKVTELNFMYKMNDIFKN